MNAFSIPRDRIGDSALAARLRRETAGEVLFASEDSSTTPALSATTPIQ